MSNYTEYVGFYAVPERIEKVQVTDHKSNHSAPVCLMSGMDCLDLGYASGVLGFGLH